MILPKIAVTLLLPKIAVTLLLQSVNGESCQRRVCYYYSNSQNRPTPETKFTPGKINPSLCTHIVYNAALVVGSNLVPSEPYDESSDMCVGDYEKVISLKVFQINLQVLLSVEANDCENDSFLNMTSNEDLRKQFAASVIAFLRKHTFDGLVFWCLFFGQAKTKPQSRTGLTDLVATLRQAFEQEASGSSKLQLVLGVYGEKIFDDDTYDVAAISKNVDWIDMSAVNLHGEWNLAVGHHSPLYPAFKNKGVNPNMCVDTAVNHWITRGAPRDKLVIALPAYGYSLTLTSSQEDVGAPAKMGPVGPYTNSFSTMAYYEICLILSQNKTRQGYLDYQGVPYLVNGNQWVGYDDVTSLTEKVRYLKRQGLGGFLFLSLDVDDFNGQFCEQGPYPLLTAITIECFQ